MSDESVERIENHYRMRSRALRAAHELGALHTPEPLPTSKRRRTGLAPATDGTLMLALVEEGGVWRLREGGERAPLPAGTRAPRRMRRRDAASLTELDAADLIPLRRLPNDQVRSALVALDHKLTPIQGLRPFDLGTRKLGAPIGHAPPGAKRILLVVHGTFSESQSMLDSFSRAPDCGNALYQHLAARYDRAYAFDHPTLTVDPVVNARELSLALHGCGATVDVICHSRGGLVTRWWADALDKGNAKPGQIIFVGSPLAGTGLAAAPNLRKTLDLLANIAAGLGFASAGVPFLNAAIGLFQALSSVSRFAANTPVPDVLIGLVPGLRAMSRVGNNTELLALRRNAGAPGKERCFVRANFEPTDVGWKFWKAFRKPGERLKDAAFDAIFDGENDLVVDTPSMTDWADLTGSGGRVPKSNVCDFGTSATVHHTNYFEQKKTLDFLIDKLR